MLVRLDGVAGIAVRGADAQHFLHNQLTCDVRKVVPGGAEGGPGHAEPGALCTPKGRVVAYFDLLPWPEGYVLALDRSVAPALLAHLKKMIFRAKVTLEELPEGFLGAFDAGSIPPGARAWPRPGGGRFLVAGASVDAGDAGGAAALAWELAEIDAEVPRVTSATSELFLPQFLNMDERGGLVFNKCFPGQEVVTRTQHLGEVKRRMLPARVAAEEAPAPGTALRALHDDGERDGGTVVRAALAAPGDVRLLAVVPVAEHAAGRPIHVASGSGPRLTFLR